MRFRGRLLAFSASGAVSHVSILEWKPASYHSNHSSERTPLPPPRKAVINCGVFESWFSKMAVLLKAWRDSRELCDNKSANHW